MTVRPIVVGALGKVPKRIGKGMVTVGNRGKNQDHPDCSSIKNGQNTEKSPE